jgi:DNA polymerase-3 subunit gamma/tau
LFGHILAGNAPAVLAAVADQHDLGVEPAALLRGLLEVAHGVTRAKVGGGDDPALSHEEREAYALWGSALGFVALHRLWQLLLKGHGEVQSAVMPREAAEMALLRVVHASQLPDPGELVRKLQDGGAIGASAPATPAPTESQAPLLSMPADFPTLVRALDNGGKALLAQQLHDFVGLVRYQPPDLVIRPQKPLPADFARDLGAALKAVTGAAWQVTVADGPADPSLLDREKAAEVSARDAILASPVVKAAFEAFPEAELMDYSGPQSGDAPRSLAS